MLTPKQLDEIRSRWEQVERNTATGPTRLVYLDAIADIRHLLETIDALRVERVALAAQVAELRAFLQSLLHKFVEGPVTQRITLFLSRDPGEAVRRVRAVVSAAKSVANAILGGHTCDVVPCANQCGGSTASTCQPCVMCRAEALDEALRAMEGGDGGGAKHEIHP